MLLNTAQAILIYKSGQRNVLNILAYITAVFSTVIESVVWIAVTEMPTHEYRVYTITCVWIGQWLVTMVVLVVLYFYSSPSYLMFGSSFALVAVNALLYMLMPNTKSRTTNQIFRQFLIKN